MSRDSVHKRLLRKTENDMTQYVPYWHIQVVRRFILRLVRFRRSCSHRYLERPKTYSNHYPTLDNDHHSPQYSRLTYTFFMGFNQTTFTTVIRPDQAICEHSKPPNFILTQTASSRLTFFNSKAAKARMTVEQAFGMLKARFSILCSANMRMILTINAACILHNLLVRNWKAVDVNDLQNTMHEEREVRAERLRHEDYFKQFPEQHRRRQEVVREIQMIDERRRAL
nr:hypothetical protein L204_01855 [Cryptococcus depauperatus CBS 7855]